jgi:hypothetical protein
VKVLGVPMEDSSRNVELGNGAGIGPGMMEDLTESGYEENAEKQQTPEMIAHW